MLLALTGVPALFWLPSLPFFPESPRSTLIQKRDEEVRQGTGDTGCSVKTFPPRSLPSRLPVPAKHPSLVPEAENGQGAGWGNALHNAGTSGTGQRCRWHWGVQGNSEVWSSGEHGESRHHGWWALTSASLPRWGCGCDWGHGHGVGDLAGVQ